MGKFQGVLLVSDFDGTLYTHGGTVPQANLAALSRFTEEGGRFTVATGRALTTFAPYLSLSPINAPVILSNGSALYDFQSGRMLRQTFLPDTAAEDLSLLCQEIPEIGFEAYHGEEIYVHNPNYITDYHMEKVGAAYTSCPIEEMPRPWTKVILQQERPLLNTARAWLEGHCPGRYEAVFSAPAYLELTQAGSHKGSMTLHLAEYLGITPEHVYCVGDNENDLPMLAVSAVPFAPGDCTAEVRQWGAKLLRPCCDGTLADVVAELDKRYSGSRA